MLIKRGLIIHAAREAFLNGGYADTSMDSIAKGAGVSIKTVYRHFDNKDDLFSAVMRAACSTDVSGDPSAQRVWLDKAPRVALNLAAVEYLRHALSAEQVALYRVVVRDAGRFPELGKQYSQEVIEGRNKLIVEYFERWSPSQGWKIKDLIGAANTFAGVLRSGWFDSILLGTESVKEAALLKHAKTGAAQMRVLLDSHTL
jgi:AcrR family transcriptional regulator